MAWYRLMFHPSVVEDLGGIDCSMAQRLFDKTKWIASNIDNLRHEPVAPDLLELCKYAVNDWRIFYMINRPEQQVHIHAIVPRKLFRS